MIRVLIVEDDFISSTLLQRQCATSGYSVISAVSSGEDAIRVAQEDSPDVILMDINLEGEMDGIDTADFIFRKFSVPVIFITVSTDDETIDRAKRSNPYGYLIKPVDQKDLKMGIEMALLRHSLEKTIRENEERVSTILNSIGDAVVVIGPDNRITYMNPVAEIIVECSMLRAMGQKFSDVIRIQGDSGTVITAISGVNSDLLPERQYILNSSGSRIPIESKISAQMDVQGNFIGTVLIFRDVTDRVLSEEKTRETVNQLRKAMGGVIEAMARTIETRDPYTAGHQRKTADLARSIAETMRLSGEIIEGIRMAGVIHDLGKISVPAEILSKPGRITAVEFNLIKSHSQIGYDILKTIDFPWPVADIVYEHHERLDGSGYPRGLNGREMSVGGRIMAVADVVEAMASHRPYRAALGVDSAIEEITVNSGILYDSDVVKACVHLFMEKNYAFPNPA
jgi:PAS domain S-box-containing protein/putative nucleotidyltransferase with HDIG domain